MTRVRVTIDFASAASWLAIAPTLSLAAEYTLEIDWQVLLRPAIQRPARAAANADRGTQHRDRRASYLEADIRRYASDRGVPIRDDFSYAYPPFAVHHAAAGLLYVRNHRPRDAGRFVEAVYDYGFGAPGTAAEPEHILGPEQIAALVEKTTGAAYALVLRYLTTVAVAELAQHQQMLIEQGISQTPTFDFEENRFIGRAHLPWLRWRLSQQQSRRPS